MTDSDIEFAIRYAKYYQEWRRSEDDIPPPMPKPSLIGSSIDILIQVAEKYQSENKEDSEENN